MKIKCPQCDFENEEGSSFCIKCNIPLIKYDELEKRNVINKEEEKVDEKEEEIYSEIKNEELILIKAKGIGGDLELLNNKIRIKRKGGMAFLLHGLKGDKEVFLNQISSIQLKKAGFLFNGYIQFAFLGGKEAKGGLFQATSDENTIMFTKDNQQDFIEIKNAIEEQIFQFQNQDKNDKTSLGINDLKKLAKLRDEGIITEEDFQAKKRQILGI
jgi:hypothetical protein